MELVFEMRELEAAGDSTAGEITVSGPQDCPPPPFWRPLVFFSLRQCYRIRIRIQEGKNNPQKYNIVTNKFHAFFEVLDVLFCELKASPIRWFGESPTLRLGESGSRWLSHSPTPWLAESAIECLKEYSPHWWVWELSSPLLGELATPRLGESGSR